MGDGGPRDRGASHRRAGGALSDVTGGSTGGPARVPAGGSPRGARRGWFRAQLLIGWLPVWALYVAIVMLVHGVAFLPAARVAAQAILLAALAGWPVLRATARFPWPVPMRPLFVVAHLAGAVAYATAWVTLLAAYSWLHGGGFRIAAPGALPVGVMGVWVYIALVGVAYASRATARAAEAEATAARSQLATLRSQLDPHFLFNALHTVVQLIPVEPDRAVEAAERLAALLRAVVEEARDRVPLGDELAFVGRYLELEALRFGPRLVVRVDATAPATRPVPPFVLLALVENAVRHGAAPRVEPTTVTVRTRLDGARLVLTVEDDGAGAAPSAFDGAGTGLRRLRERLAALFGAAASLTLRSAPGAGCTATLVLPAAAPDPDADA